MVCVAPAGLNRDAGHAIHGKNRPITSLVKRRPNSVARQQYKDEIDALILKMGLTLPDPMKGRLYT